MTLFLLLFFAVGFGLLGWGLYSLRQAQVARTWPTTPGTVLQCDLVEHSNSDGTTYQAKAHYRYQVGSQALEGDRIAFGYSASSGSAAHQDIVQRLTAAKSVLVRYDPADPRRAVLSYGLNRSTLLILVFAVVWLLFVTGFTALWWLNTQPDTGLLSGLVTTL